MTMGRGGGGRETAGDWGRGEPGSGIEPSINGGRGSGQNTGGGQAGLQIQSLAMALRPGRGKMLLVLQQWCHDAHA